MGLSNMMLSLSALLQIGAVPIVAIPDIAISHSAFSDGAASKCAVLLLVDCGHAITTHVSEHQIQQQYGQYETHHSK